MKRVGSSLCLALLVACGSPAEEVGNEPVRSNGSAGRSGGSGTGGIGNQGGAGRAAAGQGGAAIAGGAGTTGGADAGSGDTPGTAGNPGGGGAAGTGAATGGKGGAAGAEPSTAGSAGSGGEGGTTGTGGGVTAPLPYPTRTAMRVKGLQPDFHPNKDEIAGNNTGGIAMNLLWAAWEGTPKNAPCAANEEEFDGRCFVIDGPVDAAIADWTARGLVVTAVAYGSPAWSRTKHACSPQAPGFDIFCTPDDMADYARFMGMIARRYDGLHGHGRLADFVVWNEVNANDWFDIGCGQGTACNVNAWLDAYGSMYNAAYDAVVKQQPHAKVLASLEHHWGNEFDKPADEHPLLSGRTLVDGLAARVGGRAMRVAYHPYPPNLLAPQFSPDDFPRITYGNLGAIVGYMHAAFPDRPSTWEVQLTESGVNSIGASSQAAQADGVCKSLRNVVGTPGIESYIYHRMHDHPVETAQGLALGLWDDQGKPKAAWSTWALANRDDLSPKQLSCGFEDLPYVRLRRSSHPTRGHWSSTRVAPSGFTEEQSYRLHHDPQPQTHLLFECLVGQHTMISAAPSCEGQVPMGPVGYVWEQPGDGRVELFRCSVAAGKDHFVSTSSTCEGQTKEQSLGWVVP